MSTTVAYKGNTLTTVNNATKTLKTAGKYMEGDVVLTDTTVDLSSDTVTPATLMQGYTAHDASGILIVGEATGGDEGSAYQDEDGYIVLGEDESSAPQGNLSITANGTYDVAQYASASVASGGATPSATKSSVSNHSITVTPKVTRTAGWVSAGTSNGTAVTVSASELVSGSTTITDNGTTDVTNLASVTVDIDYVEYHVSTSAPASSDGADGDIWLVTA